MGIDGEVKQRQHFYHHGDNICHPKSGYVTTKLHVTSTRLGQVSMKCKVLGIFGEKLVNIHFYII